MDLSVLEFSQHWLIIYNATVHIKYKSLAEIVTVTKIYILLNIPNIQTSQISQRLTKAFDSFRLAPRGMHCSKTDTYRCSKYSLKYICFWFENLQFLY